MSKYIIKNCPCYVNYAYKLHLCCDGQGEGECQDCTDCVMKQIVEKCKLFQNNYLVNDGIQLLTNSILNDLDIQEVE